MQLSPCPSHATLARLAARPASDRALAAHIAGCAACTQALAELRVLGAAMSRAPLAEPQTTDCLDEMAVARIVDGGIRPAEIAHAAGCAGCRSRIADVAAAGSTKSVAAEVERIESSRPDWRRRFLGTAGLAAAATLIFVFAQQSSGDRASEVDTYRDPAAMAPVVPALISPLDAVVMRPVALRWQSTPDATQYHVTVFDAEGSIVWDSETADTTLTIPGTVPLVHGTTYWWRVEARVGFDRWSRSDVTPFTIGR